MMAHGLVLRQPRDIEGSNFLVPADSAGFACAADLRWARRAG